MAGVAALLIAAGAACGSLARAFGSRPEEGGAGFEVRNGADIGVNVYALPRSALSEVFLGQVGPGRTRKFRIQGAAPGDTVSLRATAIDGRPQYLREALAVGPGAVWQIP